MVRKQHKVLSIILCLILAVSAVCAGTVGTFAATGDTVYVRLNNGWNTVYAYMWFKGTDTNNQVWPGVQMTKVTDNVYSYSVTDNFDMIVFNNGNGGDGNQTGDLDYAGNGKIYDLAAGKWESYVTNPTTATTATSATSSTKATVPSGDGTTVYLKNEAGWSNVHCYMWNSDSDKNAEWPGKPMVNIGDDIYQYTASKTFANCIFNVGSNVTQTENLTAMNGYIYNNSTKQWSVYDTSPLQVKSFTADPNKGVYVGSDITLSALAVNNSGAAVSYKFSASNASGNTELISDFSSANSVVWTPQAAGKYTINFDFKDTDNNINSRTLEITVEDDSALENPVIKSVTPVNNSLVKANSPVTVSVKAGGAKIGTELKFYKYVVKDPSGAQNIAYYTLNDTYNFTPEKLGTYTVSVYVQGSDNRTVSQTYTYTSTNDGNVTNPTPAPTTATKPTTNPSVIKGDADGDGVLTVMDATYIQKSLVDIDGYGPVDIKVGDMDGDGRISVKDATDIQLLLIQ